MRPFAHGNHSYAENANHSCAHTCNYRYVRTISDTLTLLRESRDYSLTEVGRHVGVSRQAVKKWENGDTANLKLENLKAICRLYGISADDLIAGRISTAYPKDRASNSGSSLLVCEPDHSQYDDAARKCNSVFPQDLREQFAQLTEPGKQFVIAALGATLKTAAEIYSTHPKQTAA